MSGSTLLNEWIDDGSSLTPKNSRNIEIPTGKRLNSATEKGDPTWGADIFTDGDMQNWTDAVTLTSWTDTDAGSPDGGSIARESSIVPSGLTYSCKIISGSTTEGYQVFQGKTGLGVGDTYRVKINAHSGTSTTLTVIVWNDTPATATYAWNFTTSAWTAVVGGPSGDQMKDITIDGTWTEYTAASSITVPTGGKLYVSYAEVSGSSNTIYVAKARLEPYSSTPITAFDFSSSSDFSKLDASDTLVKFTLTGGTAKGILAIDNDGGWSTDLSEYDFSGITFKVGDPGSNTEAANKIYADKAGEFQTTFSTAIDMTLTGTTDLYTVPSGYYFYYDRFLYEIVSIDSVTNGATINIGHTGANYNDYIDTYSMPTSLTSPGNYSILDVGGLSSFYSAKATPGSVIKLNITTGATATTLTIKFKLIGMLVSS